MKNYNPEQLSELLEQVIKLRLCVYPSDTLDEIEFLINHELKKFVETPEKYE